MADDFANWGNNFCDEVERQRKAETPAQTAKRVASQIDRINHHVEKLKHSIDVLAAKHIPDFHFMNHKVSTFWKCEDSPIGKCVWDISERGFNLGVECHYCHGPVERK